MLRFRLVEEARSAITLIRCFLHENTQRGKIARVKFAEELDTMSKNRLRWITLVRGPVWGIHSLTLMISWDEPILLAEKEKKKKVNSEERNERKCFEDVRNAWGERKTKGSWKGK